MPESTLRDLVNGATRALERAGVVNARGDALRLAEHVLGESALVLAMAPEPSPAFAPEYLGLVERRVRREPLQHLTGRAHFRYLEVAVEPGVFVPRPETEMAVEPALAEAREIAARCGRPALVVDLCCGSGVIAISIASEAPGTLVFAVDVSSAAVELARRNAVGAGVADALSLSVGDVADPLLLAQFTRRADVVISNPPYIPDDAIPRDPEVREHDPSAALFGGGPSGLDLPGAVVRCAERLLLPGGLFVMEHADVQGADVRALLERQASFTDIATHPDLTGRDRFVIARSRSAEDVVGGSPS